jgi:hypothetical protein
MAHSAQEPAMTEKQKMLIAIKQAIERMPDDEQFKIMSCHLALKGVMDLYKPEYSGVALALLGAEEAAGDSDDRV